MAIKRLTKEQKQAKEERRKKYMTIFVNGKQVKVKRPQEIDGVSIDEFIRRNAGPLWLHQNELWEYADDFQRVEGRELRECDKEYYQVVDGEIPF